MSKLNHKQKDAKIQELQAALALAEANAGEPVKEPNTPESEQRCALKEQKKADEWLTAQLQRLDNVSIFRGTIWFAREGEIEGRNGKKLYNSSICLTWGKGKGREWRMFKMYDGGKAARRFKDYQQKSNSTKDDAPEGMGWRQDLIIAGEPGGWSQYDEQEKKHKAVINTQPSETEYFEWYA